jgi:hypothetical protein
MSASKPLSPFEEGIYAVMQRHWTFLHAENTPEERFNYYRSLGGEESDLLRFAEWQLSDQKDHAMQIQLHKQLTHDSAPSPFQQQIEINKEVYRVRDVSGRVSYYLSDGTLISEQERNEREAERKRNEEKKRQEQNSWREPWETSERHELYFLNKEAEKRRNEQGKQESAVDQGFLIPGIAEYPNPLDHMLPTRDGFGTFIGHTTSNGGFIPLQIREDEEEDSDTAPDLV